MRIRIGTRGSKLALLQTQRVVKKIKSVIPDLEEEIKVIKTGGDIQLGKTGSGVFVNEINRAVLRGEVDIGVHSLKDLPIKLPRNLLLACVPERLDPNDALVSRSGADLYGLPKGSVIGTSSPRRKAEINHLRPDLRFKDIRGNIDTRIKKMEAGLYNGMVVAHAALERFGLKELVAQRFELDEVVPAAGQGALAVVCRGDWVLLDRLSQINDETAWRETECERIFMGESRFGCKTPVGAVARSEGKMMKLMVAVHRKGRKLLVMKGKDPKELGSKAAETIRGHDGG